jgi:hypothetical protein
MHLLLSIAFFRPLVLTCLNAFASRSASKAADHLSYADRPDTGFGRGLRNIP